MRLIPLNKEIDILQECGYTSPLDYDDKLFHGHQKGVAICLINKETGVVEENMLRKNLPNKDELLKMILESKAIIKVADEITQMENGKLVKKTLIFLPYAVAGHSVFKNTVNFDNISGATNVEYELDIEVLFVHENLNRYMTFKMCTTNVSMMDGIYSIFEDDEELKKELIDQGCRIAGAEDETGDEDDIVVDFYDEAGNRYEYGFPSGERLRDTIASVRIIDLKMEVKDESDKEQ